MSVTPDLDFGVRHVVDRADDKLVRTVRDAIATVGTLTAAGACGVSDTVLLDSLAGRPYGAVVAGSWAIKRRARDAGVWRGGADLSPAVAAAIHHRSFDRITLERLP